MVMVAVSVVEVVVVVAVVEVAVVEYVKWGIEEYRHIHYCCCGYNNDNNSNTRHIIIERER